MSKKQFTRADRKKARECALEILAKSQENTRLTEEIKSSRAELAKILEGIQKNELDIECVSEASEPFTINVKVVERLTSLVYNNKVLKENLGKELYNEVIDKSYEIVDMQGLIKLLKEYGVPSQKFRKYVNVTEKVNNAKIQQLFSVGEVTSKQIEGAYTAKITKSIQVRKK